MLVLSRDKGQEIIIEDDIIIRVIGVQGNKVRLGIEAPPSVSVHRKEIYDLIKKQNRHV